MLFNAVTVLAVGSTLFVATHAYAIPARAPARTYTQTQTANDGQGAIVTNSHNGPVSVGQDGGVNQLQIALPINNKKLGARPKIEQTQTGTATQKADVKGTKGTVLVDQGTGVIQDQYASGTGGSPLRTAKIAQDQDATVKQVADVSDSKKSVDVLQIADTDQRQRAAVNDRYQRPAGSIGQTQDSTLQQDATVAKSGGSVDILQFGGVKQVQNGASDGGFL